MSGLQFFGKQSVLQAYRSREIPTWAIFQQKNLNSSGTSEEQLSKYLDMLAPSGSGCQYTLKVYAGIDDPNDVTDRTESNGAFNFKLGEGGTVGGTGAAHGTMESMIMQKLSGIIAQDVSDAIEDRLNGRSNQDEDVFSIGAIARPYIEEPTKLIGLLRELRGLLNGGAQNVQQPYMQPDQYANAVPFVQQQPQKVAGVKTAPAASNGLSGAKPQPTEQELTRLGNALDILGTADPLIIEHLEKLADLSRSDPDMFRSIIKKFNFL